MNDLDEFLKNMDFKKPAVKYKGRFTVSLAMVEYFMNIHQDENVILHMTKKGKEYICEGYYKK